MSRENNLSDAVFFAWQSRVCGLLIFNCCSRLTHCIQMDRKKYQINRITKRLIIVSPTEALAPGLHRTIVRLPQRFYMQLTSETTCSEAINSLANHITLWQNLWPLDFLRVCRPLPRLIISRFLDLLHVKTLFVSPVIFCIRHKWMICSKRGTLFRLVDCVILL